MNAQKDFPSIFSKIFNGGAVRIQFDKNKHRIFILLK